MRMGRRLLKGLVWGMVLVGSILAGGLWFVYVYMTDGTTVARLIKEGAARYLPGSTLEPGRARLSLFGGSLVLHDAMIRQPIDGGAFTALRVPYLQIQFSSKRLFSQGKLEVAEVRASHPVLRVKRRRDGRWNLQGLLADPWPGPELEKSPPIVITNGTLEVVDLPEPAPGAQPPPHAPAVLRELMLRIEHVAGSIYQFEGSARGDMFDRLAIEGTLDIDSGRLDLGGSLSGLSLSEALRRRVPVEAKPAVDQLALNGGRVDLEGVRLHYDPKAPPASRFRYHAETRLREGVWECSRLPFPLSEVSALGVIDDGVLTLKHLEGTNGQTTVRAAGKLGLPPDACTCFDLALEITDLELDRRLRARTPPEYDELWDVFSPRGRVNVDLRVSRSVDSGPVEVAATVDCRDVAGVYRHFPYPLDHLTGRIEMAQGRLTLDLETLVGGKPIRLNGVIDDPGDDAVVKLVIEAEGAPVDDVFKKALPPDVRKIVAEFNPSGVVRARAVISRRPECGPRPRPEGLIGIDAVVDLAERCEMTWKPLPFTIRDLTGRLELHPDLWTFSDMRGRNGQALVSASGKVEKLPIPRLPNGQDPLKVDVFLRADNLPLSDELKRALPQAWRKSWDTINPAGACDIETAQVHVYPGRPDRTHIVILPRPESSVRLEIPRAPGVSKDQGGMVELRMDKVGGRFIFDDGAVGMHDVGFEFRGAQARFAKGTVKVEDTGRFDLAVKDLWVDGLRFDADLRKKMPPLMAQTALRLDDGRTFRARGDLEIGWSGRPGDFAWCRWDRTLVVFLDNTVKTAIPLEHVQGQLQAVRGWSNGAGFEVAGVLRLDSVVVAGQQFTELESPFSVKEGTARLENLKGTFLGGQLLGEGRISLDATPRYAATLSLDGAKLQEYARTLAGHQSFGGTVRARVAISGLGNDVHNLQGQGDAHVSEGTLGELPPVLKLARVVNRFLDIAPSTAEIPRNRGKTAFDSADVAFTIVNGTTTFDPIKFTGNAISLQGQGTMGPTGALDLKLSVLWGRDRIHVPLLSDLAREASTPFLIARVKGTLAYPLPKLEPLPQFSEFLKRMVRP